MILLGNPVERYPADPFLDLLEEFLDLRRKLEFELVHRRLRPFKHHLDDEAPRLAVVTLARVPWAKEVGDVEGSLDQRENK